MSLIVPAEGWSVTSEVVMPRGKNGENPFDNPHYGYRELGLALPDGELRKYFGLLVRRCVHAVVLDDARNTYLVKQPRPNAMEEGSGIIPVTWELPGGFADHPKGLEASIRQEVVEEARGNGASVRELRGAFTAPGVSNEVDTIFLVEGFQSDKFAQGSGEATEQDMTVLAAPFDEIYSRIMDGEIPTSHQTISGLAMADYVLRAA